VAVLAEVPPTRGAVRVLEARAASPGRAWAKALAGVKRLARDRARQYAERALAMGREAERLNAHAEAILAALRADPPRGQGARTSERPNA
jgi:D-serine deaminase-like pyridoxal phosphate-dependent protein